MGEERDGQQGPGGPGEPGPDAALGRLDGLAEEFRRRQRTRPELVVRPWWTQAECPSPGSRRTGGASGFVVEYCPDGVKSAEIAVRRDRVRVEGPDGVLDAPLDLEDGWLLGGKDRRCPETVANHLLWMADRLLKGEAA